MRVNPSIHKVQALCVCNTRELARQIFGVLQKLTAFFPVDMMEVLPGVDGLFVVEMTHCLYSPPPYPVPLFTTHYWEELFVDFFSLSARWERESVLTRRVCPLKLMFCFSDKMTVNCPVVVGTPGKILRMVERRKLDLSRLQVFVLDEADKMVEENAGFLSEMRKLKRCVVVFPMLGVCVSESGDFFHDFSFSLFRSKMPQEVQVLLFSATYEVEVRIAASEICPNAQVFRVESNQGARTYYLFPFPSLVCACMYVVMVCML